MSLEIGCESVANLTNDTAEIRFRALQQVESKLYRALAHNLDLQFDYFELCKQLIRWFGCQPLMAVDKVLKLLARLLKSPYGEKAVKKIGISRLKLELDKIQQILHNQKSGECKIIENIFEILHEYEEKTVLTAREDEVTSTIENLSAPETDEDIEQIYQLRSEDYESVWSSPTSADYNSLNFLADILDGDRSSTEEIENALLYLHITMPDYPAEYMLQTPHIFLKILILFERKDLYSKISISIVKTIQCFLKVLNQRFHKLQKVELCAIPYSVHQIIKCNERSPPIRNQLKVAKAMYLLLDIFLDQLQMHILSTRSDIFTILESIEIILQIVNNQKLCFDEKHIMQIVHIKEKLINIYKHDEQHTTIARTRYLWITFILYHMCDISIHQSNLSNIETYLKPHVYDYSLQLKFPQYHTKIKDLYFNYNKVSFKSNMLLKKFTENIKEAVEIVKQTSYVSAVSIINQSPNILQVLETLQSLKLTKILFEAIIECNSLYPTQPALKHLAVDALNQLLSIRHIPLKTYIYHSIALAIKKHSVALLNGESYCTGFRNQSLLSALIIGLPINTKTFQILIQDGFESNDTTVQQDAEKIILLLLRSHKFFGADWEIFFEELSPVLPLLQCCTKSRDINDTLLELLDPDKTNFPIIALLRNNITFLFSKETSIRAEALTRLVYVLNLLPQSSEYVPDIMEISDMLSNDVCILEVAREICQIFPVTEFCYELSVLHNLLKLLASPNVEPHVRKSSLIQLNIICNNWNMTSEFCKEEAYCLILRALENSLQKNSEVDYVESAIPAIGLLAKLLLHNYEFRQELANIPNIYILLLRTLFYFSQDIQVRHNASICLFVLVFGDFLMFSNNRSVIEAPHILENIKIPLNCELKSTNFNNNANTDSISSNFENQLEWNTYLKQVIVLSFCTTATLPKREVENMHQLLDIKASLLAKQQDVKLIKATDINYNIRALLKTISNAVDERTLIKAVNSLKFQILLCNLGYNSHLEFPTDIASEIFLLLNKYLQVTPGNIEDRHIYLCILNFINLCICLSLKPIISNFLTVLQNDRYHGLLVMISNFELPINIYMSISKFLVGLFSKHFVNRTSADQEFLNNLFELLQQMAQQFYKKRQLLQTRCLLHVLQTITQYKLSLPMKILYSRSLLFVKLSIGIKSLTQTGSQWQRDCLLNIVQIFSQLTNEFKLQITESALKHVIGLCGHRDAEVRALAWVWLNQIALIEVPKEQNNNLKFNKGIQLLISILAYLPGGFSGCCISTFLDTSEVALVRTFAGHIFVLCLKEMDNIQQCITFLQQHVFFCKACNLLDSCLFERFLPSCKYFIQSSLSREITTCEIVTCVTSICITLLKRFPEYASEMCENPLLLKLYELFKLPIKLNNIVFIEMCTQICQLYAVCSKHNFAFLQRTLCHDERWLQSFFGLFNSIMLGFDENRIHFLQLLLILCQDDYVYRKFCHNLTGTFKFHVLFENSLTISNIDSPIQRCTLAFLTFLLLKSQNEDTELMSSDLTSSNFKEYLENTSSSSHKINNTNISQHKKITHNKKKFSLNEDKLNEKKIIIDLDEIGANDNLSISSLLFVDLYKIFTHLFPEGSCKFDTPPSITKIQICEAISVLLKVSPKAQSAANNLKLFDRIIEVLKTFLQDKTNAYRTFVRRFGESKKLIIIKNIGILFHVLLNWYSPSAAVFNDDFKINEFCKVLIGIWPWILHSFQLKKIIMQLCAFLSETSLIVCRKFSMLISSYAHSILQMIIKMVLSETQKFKISNVSHSSIIILGLRVMMNCCACTEGRFTVVKEHVMDIFDGLYPLNLKSSKISLDVLNNWLQFWELCSRYSEGAHARNINALCATICRVTTDPLTRLLCLKILRNMSFLPQNRSQLMTSPEFITVVSDIITQPIKTSLIEPITYEEKLVICVTVWQLISGGVKYAAMIRGTKLHNQIRLLHDKLDAFYREESELFKQSHFAMDLYNVLEIIYHILNI